jgi:hypothetical protein
MEIANIPAEQLQKVNQKISCRCEAAFSTLPVICEL